MNNKLILRIIITIILTPYWLVLSLCGLTISLFIGPIIVGGTILDLIINEDDSQSDKWMTLLNSIFMFAVLPYSLIKSFIKTGIIFFEN